MTTGHGQKRIGIEASLAMAEAVRLCDADVVAAYPITPQTHIVERLAEMCATGELDAAILSVLTEYEEHRLLENTKKGRKIYSVRASFNLATFDQDLGELTEILKKAGEVISTLPSSGGGLGFSIDFEILFGSEKNIDEVTAMVEGENVAVTRLDVAAQDL